MTLLSDPIVVFGPRRTDVLPSRADALVALKQVVPPPRPPPRAHGRKKPKPPPPPVRTTQLDVVPSPGGHSAWSTDLVEIGGEPLVVTAVLSNADEIWLLSAAALARTPPEKQLRAALARQAVVPAGMASIDKVDPPARGAADALERGLVDQAVWGDDLARRTDAVVIGPALGEITRGKDAIKQLWKRRMKVHTREAQVGRTTAFATPDGQLAWVSMPVVRFADDQPAIPLRVFAVFGKASGAWHMIALHEAIALADPGTGAPYAKVQPPPLPAPPPPPAPPPKPKPVEHGKKKHHHHEAGDSQHLTADAKARKKDKGKTKRKDKDDDVDDDRSTHASREDRSAKRRDDRTSRDDRDDDDRHPFRDDHTATHDDRSGSDRDDRESRSRDHDDDRDSRSRDRDDRDSRSRDRDDRESGSRDRDDRDSRSRDRDDDDRDSRSRDRDDDDRDSRSRDRDDRDSRSRDRDDDDRDSHSRHRDDDRDGD